MCFGSVATLEYHASWHSPTTQGIATTMLVLTNIACALLAINWLRALISRRLFRPDHLMLSPLEFFRLPNAALRDSLNHLQAHVQNPNATAEQWRNFETVLLPNYALVSFAINHMKRQVLYPVLSAWFGPNVWMPLDANAQALDNAVSRIHQRMIDVQTMPVNTPARAAEDLAIRKEFASYVQGVHANMDEEETTIFPLARRYIGAKEANLMIARCWTAVQPDQWNVIVPYVVDFLPSDEARARWLETLAHANPEHVQLIGKMLYEQLDTFAYDRLIIDLPEMRPRMTSGYSRVW
jgi:hypothetical protein